MARVNVKLFYKGKPTGRAYKENLSNLGRLNRIFKNSKDKIEKDFSVRRVKDVIKRRKRIDPIKQALRNAGLGGF
jgi:hypothetical protein